MSLEHPITNTKLLFINYYASSPIAHNPHPRRLSRISHNHPPSNNAGSPTKPDSPSACSIISMQIKIADSEKQDRHLKDEKKQNLPLDTETGEGSAGTMQKHCSLIMCSKPAIRITPHNGSLCCFKAGKQIKEYC